MNKATLFGKLNEMKKILFLVKYLNSIFFTKTKFFVIHIDVIITFLI